MSKKQISLSIVTALLFFIGCLLMKMPANVALGWAAKKTNAFYPEHVQGTIWNASMARLAIPLAGTIVELGQVRWTVSQLALLRGQLQVHVDAVNNPQKISGDIVLGLNKVLKASNVEVRMDSALLAQIYPMPVRYTGFVEADLASVVIKNQQLDELQGNLLLKKINVSFSELFVLGDYAARLTAVPARAGGEKVIQADISDINAAVAVKGKAQIALKGGYFIDAVLRPQSNASPAIAQALQQMFTPATDGSFQVRLGQAL